MNFKLSILIFSFMIAGFTGMFITLYYYNMKTNEQINNNFIDSDTKINKLGYLLVEIKNNLRIQN